MNMARNGYGLAIAVIALLGLSIGNAVAMGAEPGDKPDVSIQAEDGTMLIRSEDLVSYDWKSHTITLPGELKNKLQERLQDKLIMGYKFRIVVNGKSIYTGMMISLISSRSHGTPVIVLDAEMLDMKLGKDQVRIDLGYPSMEYFMGKDPRNDDRIKEALIKLGKLQKKDAVTFSPLKKLFQQRRINIAKATMTQLRRALEQYRLDMRDYPTEMQGLDALIESPAKNARFWRGPYFEPKIPDDPWGNAYIYLVDAEGKCHLRSNGPDGKAGTPDDVVFDRR